MALVKISMCSFLSANAPGSLEHFWKWTFCTVVKKEWVSAVDQKQNSKRRSVRSFSNCYTWVSSHWMQGHAISFWFIYREGENATELQPGWNSISKRSMVGAGEFCQCLTTGRSGYQSLSSATEVAEAANLFQITLTCAKALARRGHSGVLQWSLLSQLQAGPCVQQLLQSAGATF